MHHVRGRSREIFVFIPGVFTVLERMVEPAGIEPATSSLQS